MSLSNYPKEFPCPVCGEWCKVKVTKKEKPYYFCDWCGVQVFIRAQDGVRKFAAFKGSDLLKSLEKKNSAVYSELFLMNEEIEIKSNQIAQLKEKLPLMGDEKIENKIAELNSELEKLKDQYFQQLEN